MYTDHCPTLRQIHDIVKPEVSGVTARWYDLGVQLLDKDTGVLDTIQTNHPTDASICCNQMFQKWLQMQSKANWNQLITALIKINLNTVAESVSNLIHKGKILCSFNILYSYVRTWLTSYRICCIFGGGFNLTVWQIMSRLPN